MSHSKFLLMIRQENDSAKSKAGVEAFHMRKVFFRLFLWVADCHNEDSKLKGGLQLDHSQHLLRLKKSNLTMHLKIVNELCQNVREMFIHTYCESY